jgi:hypothetical protein
VAEERSEVGRKRWQQQHYGALEQSGALLPFIALIMVIAYALHVVLRIVPAMLRQSLSAHMDATTAEDTYTFVQHTLGCLISKDMAVRTSSGKAANIG